MHMSVLRQPLLNKQLTYNPINDLTYILQITGFVMGVVVKADAPWKTLPELLAYAKANPGKLNWGTLGIGSTQHLAMERVGIAQGGLSWTHAPYRGTADTLRALLGGEIDFASESSGWAPMVEAGQLRLLAVFTAERAKRFPDVPTVKELGIDVVIDSPGGLIGPKGMDPAVVTVLADAFRAAAQEPEHLKFLENMDQPLILLDGPAYKAAMAKTYEEEKELLRRLNLLPASTTPGRSAMSEERKKVMQRFEERLARLEALAASAGALADFPPARCAERLPHDRGTADLHRDESRPPRPHQGCYPELRADRRCRRRRDQVEVRQYRRAGCFRSLAGPRASRPAHLWERATPWRS